MLPVAPGPMTMPLAAGALLGPQAAIRAVLLSEIFFLPIGRTVLVLRGCLGNFVRIVRGYFRDPSKQDPNATLILPAPVIAVGIVAARLQSRPKLW